MNLVIAITGASGVIYGVKLLQALQEIERVQTHVILSEYAIMNLQLETEYRLEDVKALAAHWYDCRDLAAPVSSGSYPVDGTVILPCSMKTLAAAAHGFCDNLISRVCDVALKERRKLVVCPRETPLNTIHLENMLRLSQMGAVIVPPMPAFYNKPETVEEVIDHHIMKVLDQFGIRYEKGKRWKAD